MASNYQWLLYQLCILCGSSFTRLLDARLLDSILVNITGLILSGLIYFSPYCIKASVLFIWFSCMHVTLLGNIMDDLPTMLVQLLLLHLLAYCMEVVCFLQSLHFLPYAGYCWGLPCAAIFASVLSFVHFRLSMVMLFCILHNDIKVFSFFYVTKGWFLCPLFFYSACP